MHLIRTWYQELSRWVEIISLPPSCCIFWTEVVLHRYLLKLCFLVENLVLWCFFEMLLYQVSNGPERDWSLSYFSVIFWKQLNFLTKNWRFFVLPTDGGSIEAGRIVGKDDLPKVEEYLRKKALRQLFDNLDCNDVEWVPPPFFFWWRLSINKFKTLNYRN